MSNKLKRFLTNFDMFIHNLRCIVILMFREVQQIYHLNSEREMSMQLCQRANWQSIIDECTNFEVTPFLQRNDQMAKATYELDKSWKNKELNPSLSRPSLSGCTMCDRTNYQNIRYKSKDCQLGWQVGSDLRDALQKNPLADLRFATIF